MMRQATMVDLLSIRAGSRRRRILSLDPPYTLVQPEASAHDLWRSRFRVRPQENFAYVYRERGVVLGYVQARYRGHRRDEWAITTLAASERARGHVWEALLEELCRAAGEREVMRITVKVPHDEPQMEAFRGLGFTNYTDEYIWGNLYLTPPSEEPERGPLRRQTGRDAWDLLRLYSAVTPPAVQRAEALGVKHWQRARMPRLPLLPQGITEKSYVWPDGNRAEAGLGGHAHLLTGTKGHWLELLYRTDGDNRRVCPLALDYLLWKAARSGNKPVYCGVREYQVEVETLLEERGFHPLSRQALLVKYLAEPIKTRQPALVPFLVPNQKLEVRNQKLEIRD